MVWFPRFGAGLGDAERRIRSLLDDEEAARGRDGAVQAEIERLKAAGWRPASAASAMPQGSSTADAARTIEAALDNADAYRAEALRRLDQQPTQLAQAASAPAATAGSVPP